VGLGVETKGGSDRVVHLIRTIADKDAQRAVIELTRKPLLNDAIVGEEGDPNGPTR
jgi:fructose-1,6-bisphosphatase/inositol monophosphatase family enzyme